MPSHRLARALRLSARSLVCFLASPPAHQPHRPNGRYSNKPFAHLSAALALSLPLLAPAQTATPLPALGLDAKGVTVSGLSSGGYMAAQFEVVHAASLAGAAVVAGGPYACAAGSVTTAMLTCSCPYDTSGGDDSLGALTTDFSRQACLTLPPDVLASRAQRAVQRNAAYIDAPSALRRHRVWLYSGDDDPVVFPSVVDSLQRFYGDMKVPTAQLRRVHGPRAGHGMPVISGGSCELTRPPFINGCNIDGAGELLNWLYPRATPPQPPTAPSTGALQPFDQTPYRQAGVFDGLDDSGWVYIPAACASGQARCGLHVAFHGCEQGQSFPMGGAPFGTRFVEGAGYNRWAEALNLVVLYPQVRRSEGDTLGSPFRFNPKGCWDFWGYTQASGDASLFASAPPYARRDAPQIRAVKAMVDALLAPRSAAPQSATLAPARGRQAAALSAD